MSYRRTQLEERYELRHAIGHGGMGVVYQAFDRLMQREVALKTILDIDAQTMALFDNEWGLLANMVHPNVISIYDIGEFLHEGTKKPFFVMPLLPGVTLDRLIRDASPKLGTSGVLAIIDQAAKGLHAAHQQGLIHRDVKPSNLFVMDDNSVKVIDFGIARMASGAQTGSLRGTYPYMAPEQFARKATTPLSDQFSLAVVTYQALCGRRPFEGDEAETIAAIQRLNPAPVSAVNPNVSYGISQVVAKALAKQPRHRFANVVEFSEALAKAHRGEPLAWFDSTRLKARLERASKRFEQGEYSFASEVLAELEGEGHLDAEIGLLRGQVDNAVRQNRIRELLESARRFIDAAEYALAEIKIDEALDLDPMHPDTLSMQAELGKRLSDNKAADWIAQARQHLDRQAFPQARETLEKLLALRPKDAEAIELIGDVRRGEERLARTREEKARAFEEAQAAWKSGGVSLAMSRAEVLMAMERDTPDTDNGRGTVYQSFYQMVQSEHRALQDGYEEAQRRLQAGDGESALAIAKPFLAKYPNHSLFQALRLEVEGRQVRISETELVNSLLDRGRRLIDSDAAAAGAMLQEVLRLDPKNAMAANLVVWIAGRKKKAEVAAEPTVTMEISRLPEEAPLPVLRPKDLLETDPGVAAVPLVADEMAKRRFLYAGIAVLLVLLIVVLAILRRGPRVIGPATFVVSLNASRAGAQILLNGQPCGISTCEMTLAEGSYRAEARLPGYVTAVAAFQISRDKASRTVELILVPAPPVVTISTDLANRSMTVDGANVGQLQDRGAEIPTLAVGNHQVAIVSGDLGASFVVEMATDAMPKIQLPIQATGVRVYVAVVLGRDVKWYSSVPDLTVALDGNELKDVAAGTHELTFLGTAGEEERIVFEPKGSPVMYVKVMSAARVKL